MTDFIQDGTGFGYRAKVSEENRLFVDSKDTSAATRSAMDGDLFNFNTGIIVLTSANTSGLYYFKNNEPTAEMIITRTFYNVGSSTGGSGYLVTDIIRDPTAGTLITGGTNVDPVNLNFGSSKVLNADSLKGAEGLTVTDGDTALSTLVPNPETRVVIPLDSAVLTPGSSVAIVCTPPAGNTNMPIQVGFQMYKREP